MIKIATARKLWRSQKIDDCTVCNHVKKSTAIQWKVLFFTRVRKEPNIDNASVTEEVWLSLSAVTHNYFLQKVEEKTVVMVHH